MTRGRCFAIFIYRIRNSNFHVDSFHDTRSLIYHVTFLPASARPSFTVFLLLLKTFFFTAIARPSFDAASFFFSFFYRIFEFLFIFCNTKINLDKQTIALTNFAFLLTKDCFGTPRIVFDKTRIVFDNIQGLFS